MKAEIENNQSRTEGELIPTVIFEFHSLQNLWMSEGQYKECGGYKGMVKDAIIPIRDLKKIHHVLRNPEDYPTQEWEG